MPATLEELKRANYKTILAELRESTARGKARLTEQNLKPPEFIADFKFIVKN
jgi:hypothetical protein